MEGYDISISEDGRNLDAGAEILSELTLEGAVKDTLDLFLKKLVREWSSLNIATISN